MPIRGYYFITDSSLSRSGNSSDVAAAVRSGVTIVQYRNKCACSRFMYEEALYLRKICKKITFLINDRVDIACAVGADGVHIGQGDLPYSQVRKILGKKKIIGVTVHSVKEAVSAKRQGADYVGVSPIFATNTKKDTGKAVGTGMIKEIRKRVSIPIVAIGGINLANAQDVICAGAHSLCAISAVVTKKDVACEIKKFKGLFED